MDGLRVNLRLLVVAWTLLAACRRDVDSHPALRAPEIRRDATGLPAPATAVDLAQAGTAQQIAWLADDAPDLPVERLPSYLDATAACALGDYDVDTGCPAWKRYAEARRKLKAEAGTLERFAMWGLERLDHPSPAVRLLAAQLATARLERTAPQLLARAQREEEPLVLRALLTLLTQALARGVRGDLQHTARSLLDHGALVVRVTSIQILCDSPDFSPILHRLSSADPPEAAVACGCLLAHHPAQADVQAAAAGLLSQRDLSGLVRAACSQGAVAAVCDPGLEDRQRQAAWRTVLTELAPKTASRDRPAWQGIAALACMADLTPEPGWLDRPALWARLRALVDNPKAPGFARGESVKALARLGAPRLWLAGWAHRYGDKSFGSEGLIRRALDAIGPPP